MDPTLVVLHGAGGAAAAMKPLLDLLPPQVKVDCPNLVGCGGRPVPPTIRFKDWADDVMAQLDQRGIGQAVLFGYSTGGTLALHLARHHPERIRAVATLASKVVFDRRTVEHWVSLCAPEKVIAQGGVVQGVLERLHAPQDWRVLYRTMADFYPPLIDAPPLSQDDLRAIQQPALVMSSVKDLIVPFEETLDLSLALPRAHALTFPGYAHPLEVTPLRLIAHALVKWLQALGFSAAPGAGR